MASYNLNGPDNENMSAGIMDKVFIIAGFMGVMMKGEFVEEYNRRQVVRQLKERAVAKY